MLPFLIAAAAVIAIAAGSKSGWRTSSDSAPFQVKGFGDPPKRWFFWYVDRGALGVTNRGPMQMTDREAFVLETNAHISNPGVVFYRFVYSPASKTYVYDKRTESALALGKEPTPTVGAYPVVPLLRGRWPYKNFPAIVTVGSRPFKKAMWQWPRPDVIAQYREDVERDSHHLFVMHDGTYVIDHVDESNPDKGHFLEHVLNDVMLRRVSRLAE